MAMPFDAIGREFPERVATIDAASALRYAAATNDETPLVLSGDYAPPLFAVVPTNGMVLDVLVELVPAENLLTLLHGEQDIWFHQPLVPGMTLRSRAIAHSTRVGSTGTRFAIKLVSDDESGDPVLEQYFTLFLRGLGGGTDLGPDTPEHALPPGASEHPIATVTKHFDDDQTFRYRDASGDPNPIHFDESFATAAGLPGIIIHGLCTLAMATQAIVETQCGGDTSRLARIAARFKAPAFPGNDMTVTVLDLGTPGTVGYEATSGGVVILTNGLAVIR
jgi:acyl dehydratase